MACFGNHGRRIMTPNRLPTLIQHLRKVVAVRGATPDAQLLDRFLTAHDQAAFQLLVWRHAPLVYAVCRRVLRREPDAEDAFQATFLMLACKVGSMRKEGTVAGWLYRVAYCIALRARAGTINRGRHERQAGPLHAPGLPLMQRK
jgi:hypothetical protein